MNQYEALTRYLSSRQEREFILTFSEIEAIIGMQLPKTAYENRFWLVSPFRPHFGGIRQALGNANFSSDLCDDKSSVRFTLRER